MNQPATASTDDTILRAMTDADTFRVMVAQTTQTVRGVLAAQPTPAATARHLAELVTGAVLVRQTMSPFYRVQTLLTGKGGTGRLLADSHPDGSTRGLVQLPPGETDLTIGTGSRLQVMRSLATGGISQGLVDASGAASVPEAIMTYMQESEQIVSVAGIAVCMTDGQVELAGGYLVQLLPGVPREALQVMTERLTELSDAEHLLRSCGGSPQAMLDALLLGQPYSPLGEDPVRYNCWCNQDAVVAALASLSREELLELVRAQETIELSCDYCRTDYQVGRALLQGLLDPS